MCREIGLLQEQFLNEAVRLLIIAEKFKNKASRNTKKGRSKLIKVGFSKNELNKISSIFGIEIGGGIGASKTEQACVKKILSYCSNGLSLQGVEDFVKINNGGLLGSQNEKERPRLERLHLLSHFFSNHYDRLFSKPQYKKDIEIKDAVLEVGLTADEFIKYAELCRIDIKQGVNQEKKSEAYFISKRDVELIRIAYDKRINSYQELSDKIKIEEGQLFEGYYKQNRPYLKFTDIGYKIGRIKGMINSSENIIKEYIEVRKDYFRKEGFRKGDFPDLEREYRGLRRVESYKKEIEEITEKYKAYQNAFGENAKMEYEQSVELLTVFNQFSAGFSRFYNLMVKESKAVRGIYKLAGFLK